MESKLDKLSVTSDAVDVLTEAAQLIATTEPLVRPTQTDRIKGALKSKVKMFCSHVVAKSVDE